MAESEFDYIVVGAGSAGCALAGRLSENPGHSVLVVEAGPWDRSLLIHMPVAMAVIKDEASVNWQFPTEPEPHLYGRTDVYHRGKVIGGSSSINGMVFIRGNAADFDGWASMTGFPEWDYAHCLPYFKRMENTAKPGDPYRGNAGPLRVGTAPATHPLHEAFLRAGEEAGHGITDDVNGAKQDGFCRIDWTIWGGRRQSAARAFLHPALARGNLHVRVGTRVHRIAFEGRRAVGVVVAEGGRETTIRARREVVLSAGAVQSPHLLMLSGIGPADALRKHAIPVLIEKPGVGANLQDHIGVYVRHACKEPITLARWTSPLARRVMGAQWILTKTGVAASNHFETAAFLKAGQVDVPNIQFQYAPFGGGYHTVRETRAHGFQAKVTVQRPESRGRISLGSADPRDRPRILFSYLQSERDRVELRDGVRLLRDVFHTRAYDRYRGPEVGIGAGQKTNAEIDEFVRKEAVTDFHACGSCRMGPEGDPMAVVGRAGQVHGVEGLRVADTSLYPEITTANLNASAMMLGGKIADAMLGAALPPEDPRR
ncbi:MAG: choline dehydrogenase [Alphaproteobacteria bacterium]|nr:choline dehydrogenase [Alphaproteobacteria bacterium]